MHSEVYSNHRCTEAAVQFAAVKRCERWLVLGKHQMMYIGDVGKHFAPKT